jgi:hypothetical protein
VTRQMEERRGISPRRAGCSGRARLAADKPRQEYDVFGGRLEVVRCLAGDVLVESIN